MPDDCADTIFQEVECLRDRVLVRVELLGQFTPADLKAVTFESLMGHQSIAALGKFASWSVPADDLGEQQDREMVWPSALIQNLGEPRVRRQRADEHVLNPPDGIDGRVTS